MKKSAICLVLILVLILLFSSCQSKLDGGEAPVDEGGAMDDATPMVSQQEESDLRVVYTDGPKEYTVVHENTVLVVPHCYSNFPYPDDGRFWWFALNLDTMALESALENPVIKAHGDHLLFSDGEYDYAFVSEYSAEGESLGERSVFRCNADGSGKIELDLPDTFRTVCGWRYVVDRADGSLYFVVNNAANVFSHSDTTRMLKADFDANVLQTVLEITHAPDRYVTEFPVHQESYRLVGVDAGSLVIEKSVPKEGLGDSALDIPLASQYDTARFSFSVGDESAELQPYNKNWFADTVSIDNQFVDPYTNFLFSKHAGDSDVFAVSVLDPATQQSFSITFDTADYENTHGAFLSRTFIPCAATEDYFVLIVGNYTNDWWQYFPVFGLIDRDDYLRGNLVVQAFDYSLLEQAL